MTTAAKSRFSKKHYEFRARIAKAFGHPSRLLILAALQDKERCVDDLTELVGAHQSTVSKHLSVLRDAGLVETHKRRTTVFYRPAYGCVGDFLTCLDSAFHENLKNQQKAAENR